MITIELTNEEAQFIFRACNYALADMALKAGNPLPTNLRPQARLIADIKERIKTLEAEQGIDITQDL